MRTGWESARVSPLEDLVLSAMRLEATEPQTALERYQKLIDMFPASVEQDRDIQLMTRSVRGRMTKLKRQMTKTADLHVALIRNRLSKARSLAKSDPDQARQIINAVIKIYGDANWAQKPVETAKKLLERLP
jgi:hypothetical protein